VGVAEALHSHRSAAVQGLAIDTAETVVIVSGAAPLGGVALALVPGGAPVVAADAGLDHARAAGLQVALAVGDFDSAHAAPAGLPVERHPAEKDATDLELALDAALALEPRRLLVLSGVGSRLDHFAVELALIASPRFAAVEVDAVFDATTVHVVRGGRRLEGSVGDLVSLLPVHGAAVNVRTEGLAYALHGETLEPGSSRGTSNVFAEPVATIALERGVLLAIRPPSPPRDV
jgi:thiamine pyrophosphokinase